MCFFSSGPLLPDMQCLSKTCLMFGLVLRGRSRGMKVQSGCCRRGPDGGGESKPAACCLRKRAGAEQQGWRVRERQAGSGRFAFL